MKHLNLRDVFLFVVLQHKNLENVYSKRNS